MNFNQFLFFIIFLFISHSIYSQKNESQKHYWGISLAMDPFSAVKTAAEIITSDPEDSEESYNDSYDNEKREDVYAIVVLGGYYKFKPFNMFDFDAGFKLSFSNMGDDEFTRDNIRYQYQSGIDESLFTRINFCPVNVFENHSHFYTSIETGMHWSPAQMDMYTNENFAENIKLRYSRLYYEFKVGYKIGWEANALGFNMAFNNAPYQEASFRDMRRRGFYSTKKSVMILFGVDYEFGLARNESNLEQIKRKRKNKAIIRKYEGSSDRLF